MSDKDLVKRGSVAQILCVAYDDGIIDEGKLAYLISEVNKLSPVSKEMTAREFFPKWAEICATYLPDDCYHCPLYLMTPPRSCMRLMMTDVEQAVSIIEAWTQEHPERSEDNVGL